MLGYIRNRDCISYPGVGTFVLIRPAQTFYERIKYDLISVEACERWFAYRDNRNDTAHDYGEKFAETTLKLLPDFITDARELAKVIEEGEDD